MDLSIVAVVGSFLVSERILKPKSIIVVALTGILSYDLMTKTHDPASLRVYRGPGLLAFTLLCAAYSLRTWRRNGVACDELIFLPGTKYGAQYASVSTLEYFRQRVMGISTHDVDDSIEQSEEMIPIVHSDTEENNVNGISFHADKNVNSNSLDIESMDDSGANCMDDDFSSNAALRNRLDSSSSVQSSPPENSGTVNEERQSLDLTLHMTESWDMEEDENYTYAPSATTVLGGGLDLIIPVLFNFHLFTEATTHQLRAKNEGAQSELSPKILPLIFLSILIIRAIIPPTTRRRFWGTLCCTFLAPFCSSSFRDAFVGDILTSMSRPIQDIAFALFYYMAVLKGLITHKYKLDDVGNLLEHNIFLHNWVLPACAILPLWLKYMQCIRQVYDQPHMRWSRHLPNAFKYLSAALIATYAMAHPKSNRGIYWHVSFGLCTLYQTWWDTIMDWRLFHFVPSTQPPSPPYTQQPNGRIRRILHSLYFSLQQKVLFVLNSITLRSKRLYKSELFYWRIFWINALLRFCWMLNFIPAHRVSVTGDVLQTFSSDVHTYMGPILSAAEVIRRCLWCILLVELESIKITDPSFSHGDNEYGAKYEIDNSDDDTNGGNLGRILWCQVCKCSWLSNNMSACCIQKLRVLEAVFWGCVFAGLVSLTVYKL